MSIVIVYGTQVEAAGIGTLDAFCGRCVAVTDHDASMLEARHHVYFVTYASDFAGYVMTCKVCQATLPLDTRIGRRIEAREYRGDSVMTLVGVPEPEKIARMVNAFGVAHDQELAHARKSWWVGLYFAALVLAVLPLGLLLAVQLEGAVRLVALGLVAILSVVGYHFGLRVVGDLVLARSALPAVRKMLEATKLSRAELAGALERHAFHALATHVRGRWYASLDPEVPPSHGPYR